MEHYLCDPRWCVHSCCVGNKCGGKSECQANSHITMESAMNMFVVGTVSAGAILASLILTVIIYFVLETQYNIKVHQSIRKSCTDFTPPKLSKREEKS